MKTQYKVWITMGSVAFMLTGCPSSSDNPAGEVPTVQVPTDTKKPVFTSENSIRVKENTTYVVTLEATDTSKVTYSIEGTDVASFNVDADTGILSFKVEPDFETKTLYYLRSFATDTSGNKAVQDMKIHVLDVDETIPLKSKLINLHGSLWITNGQTEGTKLLKSKGDNGFGLATTLEQLEIDGFTYFKASDDTHSAELWKTDGTPEETAMVKDIAIDKNSSSPHTFIELNDLLHFVAYQKTNTGSTQIELWKSDGSESGTTKVNEITVPYGSSRVLVKADNTLFFPNSTPASNGTLHKNIELWKNNGSDVSMVVRDLKRPENQDPNDGSNPRSLAVFEDKVYFTAEVTTTYNFPRNILQALCVSDGSTNGTVPIIHMGAKNIFSTGKKLYFSGYGPNSNGYELWKSDGTADGTKIVKDINTGTMSSDPSNFIYINRLLYFVAFDDAHGYEVWRSDGTTDGTFMLKDMHTNNQRFPINPRQLHEVDGKLFISIDGDLWVSDGTTNGTKQIENLPTMDSLFTVYGELNGKLLFSGRVSSNTNTTVELWETDGTPTGSKMIHSVNYF